VSKCNLAGHVVLGCLLGLVPQIPLLASNPLNMQCSTDEDMLYLQLPPTDGALSRELKEQILAKMFEDHAGFLHACEDLKVSKARAFSELKADRTFADAVSMAREMLVEYWREEAVALADKAKGREDTPAYALAVKPRLAIASEELSRLQGKGHDNHLHLHSGDTFYISEEKRERLIEQRKRLVKTTPPEPSGTSEDRASSVPVTVVESIRQDTNQDDSNAIVEHHARNILSIASEIVAKSNDRGTPPEGVGGRPPAHKGGSL